MAILRFSPVGPLDVSSNPASLPESASERLIASGALARLQNLNLIRAGQAQTRAGSIAYQGQLAGSVSDIVDANGLMFFYTNGIGRLNDNHLGAISSHPGGCRGFALYRELNTEALSVFTLQGGRALKITGNRVAQWGITPPDQKPTVRRGDQSATYNPLVTYTGDLLIGLYQYWITYAKQAGDTVICESNPSPASTAKDATYTQGADTYASDLVVSWEPSVDAQVTHVRIYRSTSGGETPYFLTAVAVGTASYTDANADATLGDAVAVDHGVPPAGGVMSGPHYNGYIFIADGNRLYWSLPGQPEYWPGTSYVEVGGNEVEILALVEFSGQLYAFSRRGAWLIQGTGTDSFFPIPAAVATGCQHRQAVAAIDSQGIYHIGNDGVYLFGGGRDINITETRFRPLFHDESAGGMPPVKPVDHPKLFADGDSLMLIWGAGHMLRFNMASGQTHYHRFPFTLSALYWQDQRGQLIGATTGGRVYRLMADGADDDDGVPIEWLCRSKDFMLATRAHFPRWARYDVVVDAGQAAILLDDESHQTHALDRNRDSRNRLINIGNGKRCSIQLSGIGSAIIYTAEME